LINLLLVNQLILGPRVLAVIIDKAQSINLIPLCQNFYESKLITKLTLEHLILFPWFTRNMGSAFCCCLICSHDGLQPNARWMKLIKLLPAIILPLLDSKVHMERLNIFKHLIIRYGLANWDKHSLKNTSNLQVAFKVTLVLWSPPLWADDLEKRYKVNS